MIPDDDELEKKERKKESSYIVSIIYLNLFYKDLYKFAILYSLPHQELLFLFQV